MKSNEIVLEVKAYVKNIIDNFSISQHEKAEKLLNLYNQYDNKIVEKAIREVFLTSVYRKFENFINPILELSFSLKLPKINNFIFYRGFYGDQKYYFMVGMKKGKTKSTNRYLVYHKPYGKFFHECLFKIIWINDHRVLGSQIEETHIDDCFTLLNLVDFKDGTLVKNKQYKYYVDQSITFSDFIKDVEDNYVVKRNNIRSSMDTRANPYQFIINGKIY